MSDNDVMVRLTSVFRNVFGNDTLSVSRGTTAEDVHGWDSLMHINLITAIEGAFTVRFTTREIIALRNVGDLVDLVARKQSVSP